MTKRGIKAGEYCDAPWKHSLISSFSPPRPTPPPPPPRSVSAALGAAGLPARQHRGLLGGDRAPGPAQAVPTAGRGAGLLPTAGDPPPPPPRRRCRFSGSSLVLRLIGPLQRVGLRVCPLSSSSGAQPFHTLHSLSLVLLPYLLFLL